MSEQEAEVEILQEPRGGFLGMGSQPAIVRVRVRDDAGGGRSRGERAPSDDGDEARTVEGGAEQIRDEVGEPGPGTDGESAEPLEDEDSAEDLPAEVRELLEDQADIVADFLEGLFDAMDLRAEVETGVEQGTMYVDIWATDDDENVGLLIGRHGQALDALQEIVRAIVLRRTDERCQVVVDVEDYRKRRKAQLASRARDVARRVQKSGRPEELEPMNAFERKIVHDAVADIGGVSTGSEGEDPDRRVVISPA
ncbi:MAG TPA: RNA-binding cell elongation regulator Jag/EloR [Actinomycetota bacterium]